MDGNNCIDYDDGRDCSDDKYNHDCNFDDFLDYGGEKEDDCECSVDNNNCRYDCDFGNRDDMNVIMIMTYDASLWFEISSWWLAGTERYCL